ncbi:MAG: type VI secretion system baseplate subunit TssG [Azoarcus sp.]|jgi:type VI secretion system protein ImpH|nr:type VI secretion system baseplate subunit TssG [Azoarcus sp.]
MPEAKNAAGAPDIPFAEEARREPWRFDWFGIMRWLEARNPSFPRFGTAERPAYEVVRISQKPSLSFAPATLSSFARTAQGYTCIEQMAFGLYGPNGPMPIHFTEFARERCEYDNDPALQGFLDIFHHRFALLFYRAWASVQAAPSLDRREKDHFSRYVGSLIGYGEPFFDECDSVPGHARRYMAGHLVRLSRNPEGLSAILRNFFGCLFRIQEWMPRRLKLREEDCTRLGNEVAANRLGCGAICGMSVLDRQYGFRIHVGPLSFDRYRAFLPGQKHFRQLRDWVRNYVGIEFSWDTRLILRHDEIPALRLGAATGMLGWTTWLGRLTAGEDRGDLALKGERPENVLARVAEAPG